MDKIYAIGDIHGCYDELMYLVDHMGIGPEDTVVFIGDYIDRGPKSRQVLEQLIKWEKECPNYHFLLGNHEDMYLDHIMGTKRYQEGIWKWNGGENTLDSYPNRQIPDEHVKFMSRLEDYYETDDYFFVHAGLIPEVSLEENRLAIPASKRDHPFHIWAREQFIESDWDWGKLIIFGHTPNTRKIGDPIIYKNKIGIDGAVCRPARKNLIGIELPTKKIFLQQASDGKTNPYKQYRTLQAANKS